MDQLWALLSRSSPLISQIDSCWWQKTPKWSVKPYWQPVRWSVTDIFNLIVSLWRWKFFLLRCGYRSPTRGPSGAFCVDLMDEIPVSLFHTLSQVRPKVTQAEREWDGEETREVVKTLPLVPHHSRFTSTFDPGQPESEAAGMEVQLRELQAEQ